MSDLQFDTGQNEFGRPPEQASSFDLSGKLIQWGLVSNKQEASYVLIAVAVLALIGAYFLYSSLSGGTEVPSEPYYGY